MLTLPRISVILRKNERRRRMDRTEKIIQYLIDKYSPSVLISYGSFADGSANAGSDYDALLVYDGRECHDGSVIDGTPLDVFCYPAESFSGNYDPEKYLGVFDGKIIIDTDSIGQSIKNKVRSFIENAPKKDKDELRHEVEWCRKMLVRSGRNDAEGFFRWHWVLVDSLEIYFDIIGRYYYGPKKSLRYLGETDKNGFALYEAAMREFTPDALEKWIAHLELIFNERYEK